MLATIVDLAALWKVLVVVLLAGVGITALYAHGVTSLGRLADARRAGRTGAVVANGLTVAVAALVCVAALVLGFVAMTHK
jgi:UPF0716 family protein affecting phage T7 exclusion